MKQVALLALLLFDGACSPSLGPDRTISARVDRPGSIALGKTARGGKAMVVTGSADATRAGLEMLRRGGNAIDAAVAAAFALFVVDPANASLAGRAQILARLADGRFVGYDGTTELPKGARWHGTPLNPFSFVPVPGNVAALGSLARAHGRLPWGELLQPAIRLAEDGFEVGPRLAAIWRDKLFRLLRSESIRTLFLARTDEPHRQGDLFRQGRLAKTLRRLAAAGPEDFYRGAIARRIAEDMRENQGWIVFDDLARYRVRSAPVLRTRFRRREIVTLGGSAWGAPLLAMLETLDRQPALRPRWSAEDARRLATVICRTKSVRDDARARRRVGTAAEEADTTHLSVIDRQGNAVALTTSLGPRFGAGAAAKELGFIYALSYQLTRPPPWPRRRDATEMTPTIVLSGKDVRLVLGSAGSERIPSAVLQIIVNVIDRRLTLERAVNAPRLFCADDKVRVHRDMPVRVIAALKKDGYSVKAVPKGHRRHLGIVHAIFVDDRGSRHGAADPSYDGVAGGY